MFGTGNWRANTTGGGFQLSFDLTGLAVVDYYTFSLLGGTAAGAQDPQDFIGPYTLTLSNPAAASQAVVATSAAAIDDLTKQIQSPVNNFDISNHFTGITGGTLYTDAYGTIGAHDSEEFFRRIFENKYEQAPTPEQVVQGVAGLAAAGGNQIGFLANFAALDVALSDDGQSLQHTIVAVKAGRKQNAWEIDGITGATISSVAVAEIIQASAGEYLPIVRSQIDALQPPADALQPPSAPIDSESANSPSGSER